METSPPPLLEAIELSKSYGGREALKRVSMSARPGELVAVIGPNGAGKTTLLTILAEVQASDGGSVQRTLPIGWVPQQPALYGRLSLAENLRLFARLEEVQEVDETVARMLALSGLEDQAKDQVATLSGGNRQRMNIAIGLLSNPSTVLLDEPTASLDPRQRARLWDFVSRLAHKGTAVVYSTHAVWEAERYADRVLVLADGERLFWGTPRELEARVSAGGGPDGFVDFEQAFVAFLRQRGH